MIATLAAYVFFGDAARSLVRALLPIARAPLRLCVGLVLGASLLCASYGVLGQLSVRRVADIELVFHGDPAAAPRSSTSAGAGEVRVIEDRVDTARATPRNLLVLALCCALALRAATWRARAPRARPAWPRTHLATLALYAPVLLSGLAAWRSVARGYDALWYHLPIAAAFLRDAHLEPPGRDLVFYFPANVELLARSLGDAFGARALPLVQLPFALALGPLATGLARSVGAGRAAWFAGALARACPMVVFQAGLGYADVVATAALVAAALLAMEATSTRGARALGLAAASGLALGLALGGKYAALPLVATGLPVIFLFALRGEGGARPRLAQLPRALAICAVILVGIAIPAWFWYARNTRLTGNPFFPIALPQLGLRGLFLSADFNRGKELELVSSRSEWLAYPWLESLSHESGFGAAFAALVPLSLVALVWRLVAAVRRARLPRFTLPLVWALSYLATWWWGTPHEVRHLLPLVPLLGAPAALLLRGRAQLPRALTQVAIAALAIGTLVTLRLQLYSPTPELALGRASFSSLFGLPADVLAGLPAGSRIANLASRPYNFALLGPALSLVLIDFAPGHPDAAALADRRARYVFARGADLDAIRRAGEVPAHPWRVRYRSAVAASRAGWVFWGATPTDEIALWEIPPDGESNATISAP